jgi:hypothetical protein
MGRNPPGYLGEPVLNLDECRLSRRCASIKKPRLGGRGFKVSNLRRSSPPVGSAAGRGALILRRPLKVRQRSFSFTPAASSSRTLPSQPRALPRSRAPRALLWPLNVRSPTSKDAPAALSQSFLRIFSRRFSISSGSSSSTRVSSLRASPSAWSISSSLAWIACVSLCSAR